MFSDYDDEQLVAVDSENKSSPLSSVCFYVFMCRKMGQCFDLILRIQ